MKRLVILFGLVLILANPALAQVADPDDDGIGIYFEPCAITHCVARPVGETFAWLIITHPTSPEGVGSWEARITWDGPAEIVNWTLFGEGIDFNSDRYEFMVGVSAPMVNLYMWPAVVVAEATIYVYDTGEPANFYIDGNFLHSLPERAPAYLDGGEYPNYTTIKRLYQSTGGDPSVPVATINGECVVSTDETTWDSIKAMFH